MNIRDGRSIGLVILTLFAVLVGLRVLTLALSAPIVFVALALAVAGGAVGGRRSARSSRTPQVVASAPAPLAVRGPVPWLGSRLAAVEAERDALRRQVEQLRSDLAAAQESAQLAWDAAADRPPRTFPEASPDRARLLADPMSGVHPLLPGGDR